MKLVNLLKTLTQVRDLSIRNSILAKIPLSQRDQFLSIIDEGFREGDEVFKQQHLVTISASLCPKNVLSILEETEIPYDVRTV